MGFFGNYRFENGRWVDVEPDALEGKTELEGSAAPWLAVSIHDSDFTRVCYAPAGPGAGVAYLGLTPRVYFDSPGASRPTDPDREAAGLAHWWSLAHHAGAGVAEKQAEIRHFIAGDDDPPRLEDDLPDEEIFVERKTASFLEAMGLGLPDDLAP